MKYSTSINGKAYKIGDVTIDLLECIKTTLGMPGVSITWDYVVAIRNTADILAASGIIDGDDRAVIRHVINDMWHDYRPMICEPRSESPMLMSSVCYKGVMR